MEVPKWAGSKEREEATAKEEGSHPMTADDLKAARPEQRYQDWWEDGTLDERVERYVRDGGMGYPLADRLIVDLAIERERLLRERHLQDHAVEHVRVIATSSLTLME